MSDTPETDKWTGLRHRINDLAETSRRLERERDALRSAARNLRDVKGRYNTQQAAERLFALLTENADTEARRQ